jgi:O-antigen/teichoic acid export membrane protein
MRLPFIKKFDKHSTSSMILYLSSAQMISNVVRIISGILVARFVLPEMLGTFNGIGIIIGYLPILQFGVMNGLNRELPYCFGKGEFEKAKEYASISQFWELSLSVLAFLVLTFFAVYYLLQSKYLYSAGFFTYALSSIHHYYGMNYLQILFRTNRDFNKLSNITLIISIISLVTVLLVWKWQFYGLCMRSVTIISVELFFLWRWKPLSVFPKMDYRIIKEIVKVGLPIFIVGIVFALWGTAQNTLVLKLGGAEQFGFFALALMIESSMGVVVYSVSQVIYPKMAFEYGAGKGVHELLKLSFKPIIFVFILLVPSIIVVWYILPDVINWLLPRYMNGVDAARWTMLLLLISIWGVNNNIFAVLNKQKDFLYSIVIGMIIFALALFAMYYAKGFSLIIFPQAMLIGKASQLLIGYYYILKYLKIEQLYLV